VAKRNNGFPWLEVIVLAGFAWLAFADSFAPGKPAQKKRPHAIPGPVPEGLPPFPAGWEPDLPTPQLVAKRAVELLFPLWRQGEGATITEETGGHWVTYQAQIHKEPSGTKKGVGVFRVKAHLAQGADVG